VLNIVVTGSESFIGRALIALLLQRGDQVVGIDKAPPSFPGGKVFDIRSPELADHLPENADAVIHLAAVSREGDCAADPRLAFDINVTGTANVIAAARRRNVKQVVFASSEWVYGAVANDAVQDETVVIDPARVLNEYAAGKLAGEMAINVAVKRGLPAGTVLRFGIVYGPRLANWSAVEALLSDVRTKDEVVVGSLATARRFIHVRDIACGIAAAIGQTGFGIFNLAGSELLTLARLIDLSCAATRRRPRIVERDTAAASIRNPVSAKAYHALGWAPAIAIEDGIAELAAYFDRAENL
jgi:nucleoside-diphosphate-sugar epimerase